MPLKTDASKQDRIGKKQLREHLEISIRGGVSVGLTRGEWHGCE